MGNDDNAPLVGVTGGGLPAEIWRETMRRAHEGLAPRPLPRPGDDPSEPEVAARDDESVVEAVFRSVRDGLLGSGEGDTAEAEDVPRAMRRFEPGNDR
ncbi:MAG: hypothetical protein ACFBWO_18475 [Paracoccaceae bacterium]